MKRFLILIITVLTFFISCTNELNRKYDTTFINDSSIPVSFTIQNDDTIHSLQPSESCVLKKSEAETFELIDQAIFDCIDKLITPYVLDKKGIFDNFYKETNNIENDLSKNNGTFCEYCSFKDVCIKRVKEGYNVKKQW